MGSHRILRLPEVVAVAGISRSSVNRQVHQGAFPEPLRLGPNAIGWREAEVSAWIESRPSSLQRPGVANGGR